MSDLSKTDPDKYAKLLRSGIDELIELGLHIESKSSDLGSKSFRIAGDELNSDETFFTKYYISPNTGNSLRAVYKRYLSMTPSNLHEFTYDSNYGRVTHTFLSVKKGEDIVEFFIYNSSSTKKPDLQYNDIDNYYYAKFQARKDSFDQKSSKG